MENIGTLSKKGKKTLGKGSTSESLMAAQKIKKHVLEGPEKELMKLQIALGAETIARLRAE